MKSDESNHLLVEEVLKEATHFELGEIKYTCSVCGYSKKEEVEVVAHTFSAEYSFDDNNHYFLCECGEKKDFEEHDYGEGEVVTEETQFTNGLMRYTCKCGSVKEEIIDEIKSILKKVGLESKEAFRASELKNRLKNSRYLEPDTDEPYEMVKVKVDAIKKGVSVYVKSLGANAIIQSLKSNKKEVEVLIGDIKTVVKVDDLYNANKINNPQKVVVTRKVNSFILKPEINIVGKRTLEGVEEVRNFIDNAVVCNLEEVKIIHGIGEGKLLKAVREYLKSDKNVLEFRAGKYGEGENGVTIVKLK